MKDKILVVGGYGHVGRTISTRLAGHFPGRVIATGRNYQKAGAFSQETGRKVLPLKLDISAPDGYDEVLDDVSVVVMCFDQVDTGFVEACLHRGIHYIDISATYGFLSKVEALDAQAKKYGATAVLSVGLAPGLTNLLAAHAKSQLVEMQQADIFILLGSGEAAGEASIRWILDNLKAEFSVRENGMERRVSSFSEGKQTHFPNGLGNRTAYRFNFSDQHVIPKTLGLETASTWLCFDSALMTAQFALFKKTGLVNLLRFRPIYEAVVKLFQTVHVGSDEFVVKVEAQGGVNGQQSSYVSAVGGRKEGRITGTVAAEVARRLYTRSFAPGVFHIEQLFEKLEFIEAIDTDLDFTQKGLGTQPPALKQRVEKEKAVKTPSL